VNELHAPGAHLVPRVAEGSAEALVGLFDERTAAWPMPYAHGDYGTAGLFADLVLGRETAHALVSTGVVLTLAQSTPALTECALSLLSQLARSSETTEVPALLRARWNELAGFARARGARCENEWCSIASWYRLPVTI
jgi:hypothetical protein